jgi:hypothetical protein
MTANAKYVRHCLVTFYLLRSANKKESAESLTEQSLCYSTPFILTNLEKNISSKLLIEEAI